MRIANRHYLIVDVEATCADDGSLPREEMEIIEIGAVAQDATTFEVLSDFQTFVRPVRHPALTPFCVRLTSIAQDMVAGAPLFPEAIRAMTAWMSAFDDWLFCSWGNYDRGQFTQDCQYHGVPHPFGDRHFNLKAEFSRSLGLRRRFGMGAALRHLGLPLLGTHHRAIDDARNMARIVRRVCRGG
ncbi:MAG: exonuclease domain-containing protein [Planctomycetia bacterium]|nr:exonuclease domain-containing protein [Planctomycetia bacterium]